MSLAKGLIRQKTTDTTTHEEQRPSASQVKSSQVKTASQDERKGWKAPARVRLTSPRACCRVWVGKEFHIPFWWSLRFTRY